jgi:hypothetical protein
MAARSRSFDRPLQRHLFDRCASIVAMFAAALRLEFPGRLFESLAFVSGLDARQTLLRFGRLGRCPTKWSAWVATFLCIQAGARPVSQPVGSCR